MPRVLVATMSALLLVAALPARGEDDKTVTVPGLQSLVSGMGLTDTGDKKGYVSIEHQGGRDLNVTLQPVEDGKYLSLYASLGEIPASKLPSMPAEKMLEYNDSHRFYFTIGGDEAKTGYLQTRIEAAEVNPKALRDALDTLIASVDETKDLWDQDGWPASDKAGTGAAKAGGQTPAASYPVLQDEADAAWAAAPLKVKTAVFTKDKVPGFGAYEVRDTATYRSGEVVHTYIEPVYYAWKPLPGQKFGIDLSADILIRTKAGGSKIIDQKNFLRLADSFASKFKMVDMVANVTLEDSLAATDYIITFTVHDAIGNKVATVDMPFAIAK
jgi:hypothetical protein